MNEIFKIQSRENCSLSDSDEENINYLKPSSHAYRDPHKEARAQMQSEYQEISLKGQLLDNRKKKINHVLNHWFTYFQWRYIFTTSYFSDGTSFE